MGDEHQGPLAYPLQPQSEQDVIGPVHQRHGEPGRRKRRTSENLRGLRAAFS